jgi:pimeloyl-ACP methyl ester carboxylesterase
MLHGLASNSSRWREFTQNVAPAGDWDLLRLDLRGHHRSRFRGRLGHDVWTRDLAALVRHHGYDRAIFIGHSLGAQVALHFAHAHPSSAAGLVLIDPIFPDCLRGNLATVAKLRSSFRLLIRVLWFLNRMGLHRRRYRDLDLQELDRETRERLRNEPEIPISKLYARPHRDMRNLPLANYLQDLVAVTEPLPPLSAIRTPALVLLSKGAGLGNIRESEAHIARMPHAQTVVIDADHWLLTERPDESRRAIEEWCDRLTGGGR